MKNGSTTKSGESANPAPASLKSIAQHLGLSKATISAVINDAPPARTIPQETKDRIFKAVEELHYRPNYMARSLRQKRSFTIGILVPEVSEGYNASVIAGIEDQLAKSGYLYYVASHRNRPELVEKYPRRLMERAVEGFILVNTPPPPGISLPMVTVGGERRAPNICNIILDHPKGCRIAMEHLAALGHKEVAFFKGHPGSADTELRWNSICEAAHDLGIAVQDELWIQLRGLTGGLPEASTSEEGYVYAQRLLARKKHFTALFAFNDMSAIGAASAFRDSGLKLPQEVSVIGFDDIPSASFQNPRLTTVRQPLHKMGVLAASSLLERIANPGKGPERILVEPELVVRESTCAIEHARPSVARRSRRAVVAG
ncbi:MAG TPA: LacI family DNA-binding transcriptional regulator [Terriglobales bacterium]|nr:LacI family DNA-binding transcriptional regulator [Terriglobales bacterium]